MDICTATKQLPIRTNLLLICITKSGRIEIPILGICFGHQLLAYTVGAKIAFNENGLELGVAKINLNQKGQEDKLFWGIEKILLPMLRLTPHNFIIKKFFNTCQSNAKLLCRIIALENFPK